MGLASIPWLTAILAACGSILKTIWDTAKSHALLIGVFFGNLVRWVLDLIKKWGVYKFVVISAVILLVSQAVSSLFTLLDYALQIKQGWQSLMDLCPGLSWLVWDKDGVIRLCYFFKGVRTTIGMYFTTALAMWTIRQLRFNIQVALGMKLKE